MENKSLDYILVRENETIVDAMKLIDKNTKGILIVVDEDNQILGTLTDGDIRRAILSEGNLSFPIKTLYNKDPIFVQHVGNSNDIKKLFIEKKIKFIPVVDENKRIISYYEIDDFIDYNRIEKENPVLIMAGGIGTRLKPLTDEIPKPMLKVGDKPIIQTIIEQFRDYGFTNILISINYKGDIIENYLRDGKDFGVNINYIRENKRLGTAGAIKLAQEFIDKPFFVINGDILTNVNFSNMLNFHRDNNFSMTIGSRVYEMQVPYGVVNVNDHQVSSIEEKPIYTYLVNGGIYILNPEVIANIPKDKYIDITDLIDILIRNEENVGSFPIREYWMDIGKIEDYYKANNDIEKYF